MDDPVSWSEALIGATAVIAVFAFLAVAVWQVAAILRARFSPAREEAYRKMAEDVLAAQRETTRALEQMTAELAGLRERTTEVERMLKEVG
jgi:Na+-transporting methylmalonyl-CoA/oxaloacetate decarboxylase gamma subunit